jgi:hypothetical protein
MRIIIILFASMIISSCQSVEFKDAEESGRQLNRQFKGSCSDIAFSEYPEDRILMDVQKSRNKNVKTGQNCNEFDTMGGSITQCTDVYKTVTETFYVKEYVDVNRRARKQKNRSCLIQSCEKNLTDYPNAWLSEEYLGVKMRNCAWGSKATTKEGYRWFRER